MCEHRVTYWVFAKSFSPQKKFVKKLSVVAGDSMNDFCQKKMTKFTFLQRGHKFSSCENSNVIITFKTWKIAKI